MFLNIALVGMKQYSYLTIRYVSRYRAHDMIRIHFQLQTRHVFVKHGCPRRQQSQNMAKISKS